MSQPQHYDEALDPRHQHLHGHLHHSESAQVPPVVHADAHIQPRESDPAPIDPTVDTKHIIEEKTTQLDESSTDEKNETSTSIKDQQSPTGLEKPSGWKSIIKINTYKYMYRKYMWAIHIFWGCFFTAWWISIVAQDEHRHKWLIPTLLWMFIMARLITFHVPARYLLVWASWIWDRTVAKAVSYIPPNWRLLAAAVGTVAVILIGTFASPEIEGGTPRSERAISFFGCLVAIFGLWATSSNRSKINWHTVISGMLIQFIVALFVLRTKAGYDIFDFISFLCRKLLSFAKDGTAFITNTTVSQLGMFFFTVIPAIIFFIAIVHIFYYWGVIQWFIGKFAYFFYWSMRVSGAEAVVAAASPFIGQGESAILIKPFAPHLTKAEYHQIMTSGFATIAGSVLVSYISMGVSPQALISSCVMSIPASLATSKLRYPEVEQTLTDGGVVIPDDDTDEAHNVLHAFSNGAWLGIVIAGTILTNLLCIIALVALINALLTWFAGFWNIDNLTLEMIFGYIFYPVAFLIGTPRNELYDVAKLIGVKVIQNEFVAYASLSSSEYAHLSIRGRMLATYALCGFANLGSVGTNIGVLSQLAPTRTGDIASLVMSALATGCISTLLSAAVAGMVMTDLKRFEIAAEIAAAAASS
ncbi:hypothetical protein D0Z00_000331 [Geotrichum galactomycetum]|uniref:Uncharacterized protein n=1 Tax=Geotrichum galactomycetum TaxID=27317 RepID=A0ACB6VAA7_9ASCO|nr:hypothetical protein D0Z00_000331 [Geotrichum candidum]